MGDWPHLFAFGWLTYYLFVKVRGHAVVVAVGMCVNAQRCPHIHQPYPCRYRGYSFLQKNFCIIIC
jgi:hypothetical protein